MDIKFTELEKEYFFRAIIRILDIYFKKDSAGDNWLIYNGSKKLCRLISYSKFENIPNETIVKLSDYYKLTDIDIIYFKEE